MMDSYPNDWMERLGVDPDLDIRFLKDGFPRYQLPEPVMSPQLVKGNRAARRQCAREGHPYTKWTEDRGEFCTVCDGVYREFPY